MEKVIQLIKQLENTSGTNDKIKLIKDNKDNEVFKKVLYYTYNTDLQYGFSESKLRSDLEDNKDITIKMLIPKWNNPFENKKMLRNPIGFRRWVSNINQIK